MAETHSIVDADLRAGTGPFPEPRALVLPSVDFGPFLMDTVFVDAADRDLMHHHFRLSLLPWIPGLARKNPCTPPNVVFMQLFFKKPVFTSRTFLSSFLCAPAIPTLLS